MLAEVVEREYCWEDGSRPNGGTACRIQASEGVLEAKRNLSICLSETAMKSARSVWLFVLLAGPIMWAQTNPVPLINQPLVPATAAPGGPGLILTVNGTGFVSGSVVNWNGAGLATTLVSASQLTAAVAASDIVTAGTASITVSNPPPGGGTSNVDYFSVTDPATALIFSTLDFYQPGGWIGSMVVADFNGDGKSDLAGIFTAGPYVQNYVVGILLGNGDGSFQAPVVYAVGASPQSFVAADFNGDGKIDLAVANSGDDTISLLLGDGDGTFGPQTIIPLPEPMGQGLAPVWIIAGDFNADGKLDLAVALNLATSVAVLLGNGGLFNLQ